MHDPDARTYSGLGTAPGSSLSTYNSACTLMFHAPSWLVCLSVGHVHCRAQAWVDYGHAHTVHNVHTVVTLVHDIGTTQCQCRAAQDPKSSSRSSQRGQRKPDTRTHGKDSYMGSSETPVARRVVRIQSRCY